MLYIPICQRSVKSHQCIIVSIEVAHGWIWSDNQCSPFVQWLRTTSFSKECYSFALILSHTIYLSSPAGGMLNFNTKCANKPVEMLSVSLICTLVYTLQLISPAVCVKLLGAHSEDKRLKWKHSVASIYVRHGTSAMTHGKSMESWRSSNNSINRQ